MIDKIKCGNLGNYGIDLLNEKVKQILKNIESEKYYDVYEIAKDIYYNASIVCNYNEAKDKIFDKYNFNDVCNTLINMGYELNHLSSFNLETVYMLLSQWEMEEYLNSIYNEVKCEFWGELDEKETQVATIFEIGKQNNLDFVNKIYNPTYEKIKNITVDFGIESENDNKKSKNTKNSLER